MSTPPSKEELRKRIADLESSLQEAKRAYRESCRAPSKRPESKQAYDKRMRELWKSVPECEQKIAEERINLLTDFAPNDALRVINDTQPLPVREPLPPHLSGEEKTKFLRRSLYAFNMATLKWYEEEKERLSDLRKILTLERKAMENSKQNKLAIDNNVSLVLQHFGDSKSRKEMMKYLIL